MLGIAQKGKWDIAWLPGMERPGDPLAVGDALRAHIAAAMGSAQTITDTGPRPTLRRGDTGPQVSEAQRRLQAYGYDVVPDGIFGRATETAVKEFQHKRGLPADGIAGPLTWARLLD